MPFIVSLRGYDEKPMFFMQEKNGTVLLTPNRDRATRFPEERADMLAAAHNIYTLGEDALVEGAKEIPPKAEAS